MSFLKALMRGMAVAQGKLEPSTGTAPTRGRGSRSFVSADATSELDSAATRGRGSRAFVSADATGERAAVPDGEAPDAVVGRRGAVARSPEHNEGHVLPDVLADRDRGLDPRVAIPTAEHVLGLYNQNAPEHEIYGAFIRMHAADQFRLIQKEKDRLDPKELRQLTGLLAGYLSKPWVPLPGPQTMAAETKAEIIGYGGSAGGGKTDLMLGLAGQEHTRSLILRRESTQLTAIQERMQEIYASHGGRYVGSPVARMDWRDSNGVLERTIILGHCQQAHHWRSYAGQPRDFLGLDEATEFLAEQVFGLMAWVRTTKKGQRTRVLLPTNPPRGPEGAWFFRMFQPWLDDNFGGERAAPGEVRWAIRIDEDFEWLEPQFDDEGQPVEVEREGELYTPQSFTFIPSRLADNPYLVQTGYRRQIQNLPEPLRSQLLYGDFSLGREDDAWQVIPSAHIQEAMDRWTPRPPDGAAMTAVGVDVAQGGSDHTVLAPRYGDWFGPLEVHRGVDTADGPAVAALIFRVVRHNARVIVDMGGGWGGSTLDHLKEHFAATGFVPQAQATAHTSWGLAYRNLRAQAWWGFREALDPTFGEGLALPQDDDLKLELTMPRYKIEGQHLQIESKEDIRKRLGRSTDRADAVVIAWFLGNGGHGTRRQAPMQAYANTSYQDLKRSTRAGGGQRQRFARR